MMNGGTVINFFSNGRQIRQESQSNFNKLPIFDTFLRIYNHRMENRQRMKCERNTWTQKRDEKKYCVFHWLLAIGKQYHQNVLKIAIDLLLSIKFQTVEHSNHLQSIKTDCCWKRKFSLFDAYYSS